MPSWLSLVFARGSVGLLHMVTYFFPTSQCFTEKSCCWDRTFEIRLQLNSVCVGLGASGQLNGRVRRFGDLAHLLHAHANRLKDVYPRCSIRGGVPADLLFKPLPVVVVAERCFISIVDFGTGEMISVRRPSVDNPTVTSTNS